jgi:hypothetical protein
MKKTLLVLFSLLMLVLSACTDSDSVTQTLTTTTYTDTSILTSSEICLSYGKNYDNFLGYLIQQTEDDGYVLTGTAYSTEAGKSDICVLKTDKDGNELWSHTYYENTYNIGRSVQQTADGGYVMLGSAGTTTVNYDIYLNKTDKDGTEIWSRTYGEDNENEIGYSVKQTADEGYIIVGYTDQAQAGRYDIYLLKTDRNGIELWSRTFSGSGDDIGRAVQQIMDGGYIIAGYTYSSAANNYDVYLIKTDENGNEVWSRNFGGNNIDEGYAVQQTTDGGYIVAGSTCSSGAGSYDVYIVKTDQNGDELWNHTYGGSNDDEGYSLQQTTDGGYIIAGTTCSFGVNNYDVYLIKTDFDGNEVWSRTFDKSSDDGGYSIHENTDGGYLLAGSSSSSWSTGGDIYVIKLDDQGNEVNFTLFRTPGVVLSATIQKTCYPETYNEIYNKILAAVLKWTDNDGRYTIVDSEISLGYSINKKYLKEDITSEYNTDSYDFTGLVELFYLNRIYKRLTLQSSIEDGYYVDYDGKFAKYFQADGGGWEKLRREHPMASCMTTVSIPAYDPETGYVLVYMGVQCDWLMGQGGIVIFKYTRGNLEQIGYLELWVS